MGNAESQPTNDASKKKASYHVLRVAEGSPAAESGIDPFFDFVCGCNGQPLGDEIDAFTSTLEKSEGRQIVLQVWSTKRRQLRDVPLTPSRQWSASGTQEPGTQPSLLGLSLRLCSPQHALEQVWHVLEILEGSPAQSAGLVPFGDWIVGYAGGVLRGEGDFYDVVEAHVDKPLRLFVYNADYDVTREAILVPNRSWGGEGLLGCGVGYGLLHRIPKPQDRALPAPPAPPPQSTAYIAQRKASTSSQPRQSIEQTTISPPPPPHASHAYQQRQSLEQSRPAMNQPADQGYALGELSMEVGTVPEGVEGEEGQEGEDEPVVYAVHPNSRVSLSDDPYSYDPYGPQPTRQDLFASRGGAYASEGVELVSHAEEVDEDFKRPSPPPPPQKFNSYGRGEVMTDEL